MAEALSDLTPMIRQYREIKGQYPDAILMYRIGDFYEMFFEDAVEASKILDIILTSRNKNDPNPIPLCGVPYHSVEPYIAKLIAAGQKVAVCDQVEDPRLATGVVKREVTRVVTPGLDLSSDSPKESRYLAALFPGKERWGLSVIEFSTGEFRVTEGSREEILEELQTIPLGEILLPESLEPTTSINGLSPQIRVNRLPTWVFEEGTARRLLLEQFQAASLSGFDCEGIPMGIGAAGAILHYARETQKRDRFPHVTSLKRIERSSYLLLSDKTRESLDIDGLISYLDGTVTSVGGRRLREWIFHPLTSKERIEERLDAVEELVRSPAISSTIQEGLRGIYDLERIGSRLSVGSALPRDLIGLAHSLERMALVQEPLKNLSSKKLRRISLEWDLLPDLRERIERTLEGDLIRDGIDPELDDLRRVSRSSKESLALIEERERKRTGITSLKLRYNKVFGYYLEVTQANLAKVPSDYQRRQTLTNAERFVTPELKELEAKILGAEERIEIRENEIFTTLRDRAAREIPRLLSQSTRVAELDLLISLAQTAVTERLVRPLIREDTILKIIRGRHPLVEKGLPIGQFVPNDILLNPEGQRFLLITGPNMAGKSTLIRQVGLTVLMAQIGSFVPAEEAEVGIVDRLFSRIGASDRITAGESTFMVEMSETARILHYTTPRSLILLDEIGRGTSTFDGISIAWAVAEFLHDHAKARTLFATHYHEMIDLPLTRPHMKNFNVAVRQEGDEVVFLYRLVHGGMSHSFGIHVARLAGLPPIVLERAKEILKGLEHKQRKMGLNEGQGTLF